MAIIQPYLYYWILKPLLQPLEEEIDKKSQEIKDLLVEVGIRRFFPEALTGLLQEYAPFFDMEAKDFYYFPKDRSRGIVVHKVPLPKLILNKITELLENFPDNKDSDAWNISSSIMELTKLNIKFDELYHSLSFKLSIIKNPTQLKQEWPEAYASYLEVKRSRNNKTKKKFYSVEEEYLTFGQHIIQVTGGTKDSDFANTP